MGHVFRIPIIRCDNLGNTLKRLHADCGLVSYAGVIDSDAPLVASVPNAPARWCAVVGNEDKGISDEVREACEASGGGRLRIKMAPGCDSLSITVAAGILVYGLIAASD
jgi:tRNA G18 (ribose-2'-O)-methylase SpoU